MPLRDTSLDALLAGLQRLLPRGRAWPRDPGAVLTQVLRALLPNPQSLVVSANALPTDAFPTTAVYLLPEWEQSLGLPDPCAGPSPTIAQRQKQVVARMFGLGGQSIGSFTSYAASLGYPITITEFLPARFGRTRFGDRFRGPAWAHVWQVDAPGVTVTPARFGTARFGDPFSDWGNRVLECEMRRIAPAHTTIVFAYSGALAAGLWDQGDGWDQAAWGA